MGCYQKLERDSFTSFLLILCVRAYNCGFYGSVTQIEQNRESRLQKKRRHRDIGKFFFLLRKQRLFFPITQFLTSYISLITEPLVTLLGLEWRKRRRRKKWRHHFPFKNDMATDFSRILKDLKSLWQAQVSRYWFPLLPHPVLLHTRGSLVLPILRGLLSPCWPSRLYALTVQWSLSAFLFFFLSSRYYYPRNATLYHARCKIKLRLASKSYLYTVCLCMHVLPFYGYVSPP